jgi:putative membrane protein
MWPYGWQWGAWAWVTMAIMLIFWALIVAAAVYAVRAWSGPPRTPGESHESPTEILNRRYARGEITREQYQQMRDDLMRRGPGGAPSGA